ncbi:MAG: glycosyltransferase family 4 protein [Candidatus Hodarchaeota archaeon]
MKIALLTPEYVTESNFDGGLANYLQRIAISMKQRGHQVEIFTKSDRDDTIIHQGITVHRINPKISLFKLFNKLTLFRFSTSLLILSLSYTLRKRLLERHEKARFDIIQPSSYLACGIFTTINRPAPIVTRISSYEPLMRNYYKKKYTLNQRLQEWLEKLAICRSNSVYSPSKLLSHVLSSRQSINVDVLPPPFFLDTVNFDESIFNKYLLEKKYLLFYGTLGILKGAEVLTKVLPRVLSQFHDLYFVIVGKDTKNIHGSSMLQVILKQAKYHNNRIIYLGVLKHNQLYPIIENCQAVVLPSLIDNLPNTMLESMYFGKVVIGTKGTSFEEVIEDGISGILVNRNDINGLSQAIQKIWRMSEKEKKVIGKRAKERISVLLPDMICLRTERYYKDVIIKWNKNLK